MTSPADTIREALDRWVSTYHGISDMRVIADARAALTELEQQLAAAKVREDRLALGVVTKSNELARAEADRDRLQQILTSRSFSTTESGADRILELEADRDRLQARPGIEVLEDGTEIDWKGDAEYAVRQMQAYRAEAQTLRDALEQIAGGVLLRYQTRDIARAALDRQEVRDAVD